MFLSYPYLSGTISVPRNMISRRSVRIKVMQAIYGLERSEGASSSTFEKSLQKSIQSVKSLYLYLLLSVREVANVVEMESRIKASKHLPTAADLNFSTKLLSNTLIQYLNHDPEFQKEVKKTGLMSQLEADYLRKFYKHLEASEEYRSYLNSETEFDFNEDRKIVTFLFDYILLDNELFLQQVEELFPSWEDDAEFVVDAVREVFKKSREELKLHIENDTLQSKFEELNEFAIRLFNETLERKADHLSRIEPYLRNWEMDRIAVVDLIMLRMALTEFEAFNSIPVKVTMNEYIDMAKDYSTPKSKDFINGVLDRMMRDMKAKGVISKTGRGLLEG
jgi:transcription antitermination protein NusB